MLNNVTPSHNHVIRHDCEKIGGSALKWAVSVRPWLWTFNSQQTLRRELLSFSCSFVALQISFLQPAKSELTLCSKTRKSTENYLVTFNVST